MKNTINYIAKIFIFLACSLSIVGCANNQDAGTVTGAVVGGLLGSQFGGGGGQIVAIAAGTLAGAYIGGAIGKNMDDNDRLQMDRALEDNELGEPAYWRNRRSGVAYEVIPVRNVSFRGNEYCREYRTKAIINGKKRNVYGTACRQPDGAWRAVNSD